MSVIHECPECHKQLEYTAYCWNSTFIETKRGKRKESQNMRTNIGTNKIKKQTNKKKRASAIIVKSDMGESLWSFDLNSPQQDTM